MYIYIYMNFVCVCVCVCVCANECDVYLYACMQTVTHVHAHDLFMYKYKHIHACPIYRWPLFERVSIVEIGGSALKTMGINIRKISSNFFRTYSVVEHFFSDKIIRPSAPFFPPLFPPLTIYSYFQRHQSLPGHNFIKTFIRNFLR